MPNEIDQPETVSPTHAAQRPAHAHAHAHPLLAKQPRYCPACASRLPTIETIEQHQEPAHCPKCLRPFDPHNPATYLPVPPPEPTRWHQRPEAPGAAFLLLYLLGSAVITTVLPDWVVDISGTGGRGRVGDAAGAVLAVLFILFGFLPWLFACTYLLLVALENHLRDEIVIYLTAGAVLGAFCAVGYAPILMLIGAILGTLAGLIRQARMAQAV